MRQETDWGSQEDRLEERLIYGLGSGGMWNMVNPKPSHYDG